MKAAVLFETGKPLRIIDNIVMPALKRGQVHVELAYSGVCHSQLMEIKGARGEDKYVPHLLGHEATGIVLAIGPDVTKVKIGDRVILGWIKGEGIEAGGAVYQWNGQSINAGGITTFNEQAIISENRITILPDDVPMDIGVLYGCAIPTGAGMACNEIEIRPTSRVAVFGIGGVGVASLLYARAMDPALLIAVDIHDEKLSMAKTLGADVCINAANEDVLARIASLTNNEGVDFSIDAAGQVRTIETAFNAIRRKGGVCVFASHPAAGQKISIDPFEMINGKQIKGSWGGNCLPDRDIPKFIKISHNKNIPLDKLITKRYTLDNIHQALDDLEAGQVMRPLIEINPSLS